MNLRSYRKKCWENWGCSDWKSGVWKTLLRPFNTSRGLRKMERDLLAVPVVTGQGAVILN